MVNWDNVNLSQHIRKQYKQIYAVNLDDIVVIRRINLEGRNFFSEDISEGEIRYSMKANLNPVKQKGKNIDEKAMTKSLSFEVYTEPETYPTVGKDINDNDVDIAFDKFIITDIIEYNGERWRILDLNDVALNRKPMLWQSFSMKLIN